LLLLPAASRADIVAATQQFVPTVSSTGEPTGRASLDLTLIDTSSGKRFALPAGVNTGDEEFHPSLSSDGRLLVFERVSVSTGGAQVVMVNLDSRQQAVLFDAPVIARDPTISADGTRVVVGRAEPVFDPSCSPFPPTSVAVVDARAFPSGPFPFSLVTNRKGFCVAGGTSNNVASDPSITNDGSLAWGFALPGVQLGDVSLMPSRVVFAPSSASATQPAIKPDQERSVVFTRRDLGGAPPPADLAVGTFSRSAACHSRRCPRT
jgi:hypothetical protein